MKKSRKIFRFYLILLGLLSFGSILSWAAPASAQEKITAIEVQGNKSIESTLIMNQVYVKTGQVYDRAQVTEDITRIYKLGYFDDIEVEKVNSGGGVKLIYHVEEKPAIDAIVIEGNKKVSEKKIREALTVKINSPADNKKLVETKDKIKDLYAKEGMSSTTIDTVVEDHSGRKELHIKIHENQGEIVREVNFEGNHVFSQSKLRHMVKTKKKGILSFLTGSGKFREDVIDRDVAFISYNYLNKGFMKVRVSHPKVEYSEPKKGLILTFNIDEGERYRVGNIDFSGDILTTKEELFKKLSTLKGKYYSQKILEDDISKVSELYGDQGYAYTNVNPKMNLNDDTKTADIDFNIDKGQRVYIEKINITGNTITRDKVIRRELKIVENSLFNESLLKLSKRKLEQLGYFENVDVSTPRGSSDDRLIINLNVKEKPTGTFSVGAGYSSAESFLVTASVSKNNFMGLGISGSLNAEVSGKRQQFSFQYTDPYFLDSRWILNATGYKINTTFEDFQRKSLGGEVDLGRKLFDFTTFSLGYRIEDVHLDNFNIIVPEFFQQSASGLTSSLVLNLTRDTRNNPLITTKGDFESVVAEYAGNGIGGDNNFFRVTGNFRYYYPLWGTSTIKFNSRIGYIRSLDGSPVPLYERFFTGGINSLRGYEFRSVGPTLQIPNGITGPDEAFVYGGNKLLLFNLEYEFPLYDAAGFRGVVFLDAGNAYAENEALNPLHVRADFGAGFRWNSPFGPLRFEWGFPFKRHEGEKRSVFNFTIGSFF